MAQTNEKEILSDELCDKLCAAAYGKIAGAIGVGGGTEAQDCEIAEHIVRAFEEYQR